MKYETLIPLSIIGTVLLAIVNVKWHFLPYSAPPVLLMLFIAGCEIAMVLKKIFAVGVK